MVRPSCRQIFPGQLRPAPDRSFWDFFGGSSHHARIGSSGHFPATDFFITILLGPYAISLCRFFADFSVTCTLRRTWEFLHGPRLRSRPGNAPTPCRHHEPTRHRHTFKRSEGTPERFQGTTPNAPRIPGNNQNMLYTVRIH